MAFGQERMLVTPLQMAMVAGALGFGGRLMEPQVVDRVVAPGGRVVEEQHPTLIRQAVSKRTAHQVAAMMRLVVREGTGTAAQIPGYTVGGKTGTAETGIEGSNTTWFIAFAGKDEEGPRRWPLRSCCRTRAVSAERPPRRSPERSCRQSCRGRRIPNL